MEQSIETLQEQLRQAQAEIEQLRGDKHRLQQEVARLRGLLRSGSGSVKSTKLYEALRE
ncbi:hypothetical protein [Paenibacillus montanisoli]|uniref:hypothetical protein n=1 Tax=Paenibacillus montanisoli TaxID=2081970 RepID=UPI001402EACA|nr:hypothetical protein [Paenibacillus montanisoli]